MTYAFRGGNDDVSDFFSFDPSTREVTVRRDLTLAQNDPYVVSRKDLAR